MKTHTVQFNGFSVETAPEWEDITHTLEGDSKPFTLARPTNGVGALQFSPAFYRRGPLPSPSPADLLSMAEEFGRSRSLGAPYDAVTEDGALAIAGLSFHGGAEFTRVWFLSDKRNVMLATYVCDWGDQGEELTPCEAIVRSVRFDGGRERGNA
jgi:hypothetical protein